MKVLDISSLSIHVIHTMCIHKGYSLLSAGRNIHTSASESQYRIRGSFIHVTHTQTHTLSEDPLFF